MINFFSTAKNNYPRLYDFFSFAVIPAQMLASVISMPQTCFILAVVATLSKLDEKYDLFDRDNPKWDRKVAESKARQARK